MSKRMTALAIVLVVMGFMSILALADLALSTMEYQHPHTEQQRGMRYCEQALDGVYAYDDAKQTAFCQTNSGYVAL